MPSAQLSTPKFLYFDLGNVLLFFDHRQAARQMAKVLGVETGHVWNYVFAGDLNVRCDTGELTRDAFYELLCGEFCADRSRPELAALVEAASDIFEVNAPMIGILSQLSAAGYRLGVLSNTCDTHWDWLVDHGKFRVIPSIFEQLALSYRLGRMKPDPGIYATAAAMAGVAPHEVFYVDDILANVEGARAAGFDAVPYTTPQAYAAELRQRGVRINW